MVTELYERIQEGLQEKQKEITRISGDRTRDREKRLSMRG